MKAILKFQYNGRPYFVATRVDLNVLKLEQESGLKFEVTGLQNDSFGNSFINSHYPANRYFKTLAELRKHIRTMQKYGVTDLTNEFCSVE